MSTASDDLPPTQYLVMEVLAARARLGEVCWSFPRSLRSALDVLSDRRLIRYDYGPEPGFFRVFLSDEGRDEWLRGTYEPPILKAVQPSMAAVASYMLATGWVARGDGPAGRLYRHPDYEHAIGVLYDAAPGSMGWRGVIDRLARAEDRPFGAIVASVCENEQVAVSLGGEPIPTTSDGGSRP